MHIKNLWPFKDKKQQSEFNSSHFSTSERVFTPVNELVIGMYVAELDRPWLDTPFLFQGFELRTQVQIQSVQNICDYVYIDVTKTKKIVRSTFFISGVNGSKTEAPFIKADSRGIRYKRQDAFKQEIANAEKIYGNTEELVSSFMKVASKGGDIDGWLAKKAVSECVNSVLHSPDAMLWLTQLKDKDHYTVQHSLNVCILSIVLGRHLNLPKDKIVNLGLCGMMHDIGKMLLPTEILLKPDQLDEEEMKTMQLHTILGYELLKSSDNMSSAVIETALTHHERLDGKGYPRQLKNLSISQFTKIIAIADMYDAITSNRVFQKSKTHLEATHILINQAGTQVDKLLVIKFIESLGVYPPGSVVVMTNGAIGIVVEVNEEIKLRPKVILLLYEEKKPVPEQVIDLAEMVTDKNGLLYTIKNVIRGDDWNIDSRKYYQNGFLEKSFEMRGSTNT